MLYFRFRMIIVMITCQCFSCYRAVLTQFFNFSYCPASKELELCKKLGGDRIRITYPKGPKGYPIPYDIMVSNKTRIKKKKEETKNMEVFVFPINSYVR